MNEEFYKIIRGPVETVSTEVDEHIKQGWQLHGDLHVYTSPTSKAQLVLQAVKRDASS